MLDAASLQGCITALITPMSADGQIDLTQFDTLLERQIQAGIRAVVIGGSTGEGFSLSSGEYATLLQRAAELACGRLQLIAGINGYATAQQLQLARELSERAPVDGLLVTTPSYCKPSQEGLSRHFLHIAETVDCAQILYHVPGRASVYMHPETIARLSQHERIIGIKEAHEALDHQLEVLALNGEHFRVLAGNDYQALSMAAHGACGLVSVLSNLRPKAMSALLKAAGSGDFATARQHFQQLLPLMRACFVDSNPVPIKTLCAWQQDTQPHFRAPLCSGAQTTLEALRYTANEYGLNIASQTPVGAVA